MAFFAFVTVTSAERSTHPAGGLTTESFVAACDRAGGQLIDLIDPFDFVLESTCTYADGQATLCDSIVETCTVERPRQPARLRGPIGAIPADGLRDEPNASRFRPTGGPVAAPLEVGDREIRQEIWLVLTMAEAATPDGGAPSTVGSKLDAPILVPKGDRGGVVTMEEKAIDAGMLDRTQPPCSSRVGDCKPHSS